MSTKLFINPSIASALSLISLVWAVAPAQAFTFTGTASGQFGLPTTPGFGSDVVLSSQPGGVNNRLTWGVPLPDTFSSFVQFDSDTSFSTPVDSIFKVGNLTYRNGTTLAVSGFDGDFPLSIQLTFTNPAGLNESFSYLFNILNTDNLPGDLVPDDDILRFSAAGVSNGSFSFGGVNYTLALLGFATDDTGTNIINQFNSPEGATATAGLYGKITAVPVPPEPIPTPALLPGLMAMAAAALRKQRG